MIAPRPHSPAFYARMAYLRTGYQLCFRNRHHNDDFQIQGFQYSGVLSRIRSLEDGTDQALKPATPFERAPLTGYWHAHVEDLSPKGLANNMQADLRNKIRKLFKNHAGEIMTPEIAKEFSDDIVASVYERHAEGRATGEWLVFEKAASNDNTYLTLGTHAELNQAIVDRITSAGPSTS